MTQWCTDPAMSLIVVHVILCIRAVSHALGILWNDCLLVDCEVATAEYARTGVDVMTSDGAVSDGSALCMLDSLLWIRSSVKIGHGGGAADGG